MKNDAFTSFDQAVFRDLGGGVRRKVLAYGDNMMQCYLEFETGSVGAPHSHPHTQLTHILSGAFEFTIDGVTKVVRAGDTLYKRPNVVHGCVCLEKGALLDTFAPLREDFLTEKE